MSYFIIAQHWRRDPNRSTPVLESVIQHNFSDVEFAEIPRTSIVGYQIPDPITVHFPEDNGSVVNYYYEPIQVTLEVRHVATGFRNENGIASDGTITFKIDRMNVLSQQTIVLKEVTQHQLRGFTQTPECKVEVRGVVDSVSVHSQITIENSDTTLYVYYTPEKYNIYYDLGVNGELPQHAPKTYTILRECKLAAAIRDRYAFEKYEEVDAGGSYLRDVASINAGRTDDFQSIQAFLIEMRRRSIGDVHLRATWSPYIYTINFIDPVSGNHEACSGQYGDEVVAPILTRDPIPKGSVTVNFGTAFGPAPASIEVERNLEFVLTEYNTSPDGTGTTYNISSPVRVLGNLNLYAIWSQRSSGAIELPQLETQTIRESIEFDIKYEGQNHPTTMQNTREYVHVGWTTALGSNKVISGEYAPVDDCTLYAIWKQNNYFDEVILPTLPERKVESAEHECVLYYEYPDKEESSTRTMSLKVWDVLTHAQWEERYAGEGRVVGLGHALSPKRKASYTAIYNVDHEFEYITLPTLNYDGHKFLGWATSRGGRLQYAAGQRFAAKEAEVSLFPVWGNLDDVVIGFEPRGVGYPVRTEIYPKIVKAGTPIDLPQEYEFTGMTTRHISYVTVAIPHEYASQATTTQVMMQRDDRFAIYADAWHRIKPNGEYEHVGTEKFTAYEDVILNTLAHRVRQRSYYSAKNDTLRVFDITYDAEQVPVANLILQPQGGVVVTPSLPKTLDVSRQVSGYATYDWSDGSDTVDVDTRITALPTLQDPNNWEDENAKWEVDRYVVWPWASLNVPEITLRLPTPTRNNFKFLGWSKAKDSHEFVDPIITLHEDIVLYAIWEESINKDFTAIAPYQLHVSDADLIGFGYIGTMIIGNQLQVTPQRITRVWRYADGQWTPQRLFKKNSADGGNLSILDQGRLDEMILG